MEITPVLLVWIIVPLYHKKPITGKGNGGESRGFFFVRMI
jgi:hypothetical protein